MLDEHEIIKDIERKWRVTPEESASGGQQKQSTATGKRTDYLHWDDYFMAMALLTAKRSKDPVTQVGACIVDSCNRIVAIGYNGFPRNCSDDEFPWSKSTAEDTTDNKNLYVVHAEANAILNRNNTSLVGTRLYTTLFPCNECTKLIIQSGIAELYYISNKYEMKAKYAASRRMLNAAGVRYSRYLPVQKQIVIDFDEIIRDEALALGRLDVEHNTDPRTDKQTAPFKFDFGGRPAYEELAAMPPFKFDSNFGEEPDKSDQA